MENSETHDLIYIVEDHEVIATGVKQYLEMSDLNCEVFLNLTSAREGFKKRTPSLLIQDVMLPDGDGFEFVKEIKKEIFDIVSGSRYLSSQKQIDVPPEDRYTINRKITGLINKITDYGLTDSFCGFKVYRVESLKKLELSEKGYGLPLQLWIQAYKNNLTVKELPVSMIYKDKDRTFGNYLNDPKKRLAYYQKIIDSEVKKCLIY